MALDLTINAEAFEKLPEPLQAEYVEKDGNYVLDVTGMEDTGALKRAKDRESQYRRDAEKRAREMEAKLAELENDDARKRGDIETLEKAWNKKYEDLDAAAKEKLAAKDRFITTSLIDNKALEIATKISDSPALLLPHIKARLSVDLDSDTPMTKVLDKQGNPSAMTIEELSQEFVANDDFKAIIIGSKASGSSTSNSDSRPRGGASGSEDLSKMSSKELLAHIKAKKEQE